MVKTRGMLSFATSVIEDVFTNSGSLDVATESLITNICLDLKKLEANYPHISLTDFQLHISELLQRLDDALVCEKNSEAVNRELRCNVLTLEARLEREKQQRQSDLNASFNELDLIREEKEIALKRNNGFLSSLTDVKTKLENKSDECVSLQSLINEKDVTIANLRLDLEVSNNQKLELTEFATTLKSLVKIAEEKSWLKSRWIDDTILDTYFQSFMSNTKETFSKVIFMGPSVTQVVKHGTCDDVKYLLDDLVFFDSDYAFLCISNNTTNLEQDTGSHWSLLFVDISGHLVYHLDSLQGTNTLSAKAVTSQLGFEENSFHELSCTQQNNNYECGVNTLVNAKFINEGYCKKTKPGVGFSFYDWYALFNEGPRSLLVTHKSASTIGEPFHALNGLPTFASIAGDDKELNFKTVNCNKAPTKNVSEKWKKVKCKNKRAKQTGKAVFSPPSNKTVNCPNRFQALELDDNCVDGSIIHNSSGKWQPKSTKRQTKNTTDQQTNPSNCKVGQETFAQRGFMHSNVRGKVSSGTSSPMYTKRVDEKFSESPMANVLLIGDSLLRYSGKRCAESGAIVDVNPGARISHIRDKIGKYISAQPKIIYLLVGTNNLIRGFNGCQGYDGGWGKREVLHSMADLLSTAKHAFPNSVIILNSVLTRRDISQRALFFFNEQLMLMCNNFNVEFLDTGAVVRNYHLARDGTHLNRKGNDCFGNLIFHSMKIIHAAVSVEPKCVCPRLQLSDTNDPGCYSLSDKSSGNDTDELPIVVG